ncbi:MAG: Gfo/Idh/MocA family oxidoreductase [Pirellulales bacterium]|nr:Gfo/Idh/MocA family oxidoreductase [Pirellulales bacterium]
MKFYKVGIIGFGFIGKVHAFGYRNLPIYYDPVPLEARITHVATSRPETAEHGRRLVGADRAVTDFREITENPEIDIVHICTPNHLHKNALLSAIRHGKHIYCDKPLVANLAEAEEVRAALAGYRGTAQMTFQSRFFSAVMRARQLIDEGFVGEVLEYRCGLYHGGSADPRAPLKWKLSAAGGGVIADLASHALDLVHYLVGDFASILAATKTAYAQRPSVEDPSRMVPVDAEDCVMLLARMKSGALGHIEGTKLATGSEDELRVEIHGTRGALRFNGMDPHHLEAYDATAPDQPIGGMRGWTHIDVGQRYPSPAIGFPSPKNTMGWLRVHVACLSNFLQDLAAGKPGNPGLEQGIYVQELMDAARRSAAESRWIGI